MGKHFFVQYGHDKEKWFFYGGGENTPPRVYDSTTEAWEAIVGSLLVPSGYTKYARIVNEQGEPVSKIYGRMEPPLESG